MVVTQGTAAGVFSGFPVEVSGKTGTAEVFGRNPDGSTKDDTSWFAAYAPSSDPKYVAVMMVSQGGFGASTSGVAAKDVLATLFGVSGGKVDPTKAIFPSGVPNTIAKVDLIRAAKESKKTITSGSKIGGVIVK
jgi:penicillin-binding protein 2